jgi:hypothetical protein
MSTCVIPGIIHAGANESAHEYVIPGTFGDVTPAELVKLLNTQAPTTPTAVEGYR